MGTFFVSWGEGPKLRKLLLGIFNGGGRFRLVDDCVGDDGDMLFSVILAEVGLLGDEDE